MLCTSPKLFPRQYFACPPTGIHQADCAPCTPPYTIQPVNVANNSGTLVSSVDLGGPPLVVL